MDLNEHEQGMLLHVLDMHLQGMSDTKESMIEDRGTLVTLSDFDDVMQRHERDTATVTAIREKVINERTARSSRRATASSIVRALRSYVQSYAVRGNGGGGQS